MHASTPKEYPIATWALALLTALGAVAEGGCLAPGEPGTEPAAAGQQPGDAEPVAASDITGEHVVFLNLPVQQRAANEADGPVLADVVNHLPSQYGNTYWDSDKITWAHETTHGINSTVRNDMADWRNDQNGFYVLEDRAVAIDEPDMRKSVVAGYVPASLRGSRYDLYLRGMGDWDDTPTYILDEFVAYTNGGAAGVDLVQRGRWNAGWRDGGAGQLEFTVYAIALMMATEEHDPEFFRTNTQFKEFIAWNARRAMRIYREGSVLDPFEWDTQDRYYESMRSAADAANLRAFARRVFGDEVTDELLGLTPGGGEPDVGDGGDSPGGDDGSPGGGDGNDPLLPDPLPAPIDADGDGIPDDQDLCSSTPEGSRVWKAGEWIGCAGGEYRDRDLQAHGDSDGDGIRNRDDLCSQTPRGRRVWREGPWKGCAGGQLRDLDR